VERIVKEAPIPPELAGQRFDQAAAQVFDEYSRSRLKSWIDGGQLTLAGAQAAAKTRVGGGEVLRLDAEIEAAVVLAPEPIELSIAYEDDALLVVDKPAGLVVHPGAGNPSGTLQNALLAFDARLAAVPRAGIVHRLDKDTSGLLLVARTLEVHQHLVMQLEQRQIRRRYQGICQGVMTGGGTVEAPIGRHARDRTRMSVSPRGRAAVTHYRVIRRFRAHTHVAVELETGRTHQIRVHMAHIRYPLLGDPAYGGRPRLPKEPRPELVTALESFKRQALHARGLAFAHPLHGEPVDVEAEPPSDMRAMLETLARDAELDVATDD
jgi:23S rRNA pseudouridine1911/1915/1917 synthase